MAVVCVYCARETAKPILCHACSQFACERCIISRGENYCVKCFLEKCSVAERKMWTKILVGKGVIKEDIKSILNYQGNPITEFQYTRVDDKVQYVVKCRTQTGIQYNKVNADFFRKMWDRALKFGFKPERIPLGERIRVAK